MPPVAPRHRVRLLIDGRQLEQPLSYSVDVDLLQPADAWSITLPRTADSLRLAAVDAPARVEIDGVPVLTGFVGEVSLSRAEIQVRGRDRVGRLVDESIPGANYQIRDRRLSEAVRDLVQPWFTRVAFSNAVDRRLRRGRGRKAPTGREPALTAAERRAVPRHIDAGTTRWAAVESLLKPLRLVAWASADGATLICARPHYGQEPQYDFFETVEASNVLSVTWSRSVETRYALIEVSGSGRPVGVPPPPVVTLPGRKPPKRVNRSRIGIAKDGPASDGTGGDFRHPKRLFVVSDALSLDEAQAEAERTLNRQRASAQTIQVAAPAHGQIRPGARQPTLFTVDTVARVRIDAERSVADRRPETIVASSMWVSRCVYRADRRTEQTEISLLPLGTEIT